MSKEHTPAIIESIAPTRTKGFVRFRLPMLWPNKIFTAPVKVVPRALRGYRVLHTLVDVDSVKSTAHGWSVKVEFLDAVRGREEEEPG